MSLQVDFLCRRPFLTAESFQGYYPSLFSGARLGRDPRKARIAYARRNIFTVHLPCGEHASAERESCEKQERTRRRDLRQAAERIEGGTAFFSAAYASPAILLMHRVLRIAANPSAAEQAALHQGLFPDTPFCFVGALHVEFCRLTTGKVQSLCAPRHRACASGSPTANSR